jgi:predicted DNA-binding antitoxin AbrB/MazE fold protein
MLTLNSYQGVVQNGVIRLRDIRLPEGTAVLVVVAEAQTSSVEEQVRRLQAVPLEERQRRFDMLAERAEQYQAEVDIDTVSDEELNAIIHEVRAETMGKQQ